MTPRLKPALPGLALLIITLLLPASGSCAGEEARPRAVTGMRGAPAPADWEEGRPRPVNEPDPASSDRYTTLSDSDFQRVAEELGVEVAAIKAVVEIEAGKQMKGFYAPGVPVVNFDQKMYANSRAKCKGCPGDKSAKVPSGLSGYALKEWQQLTNARRVNADAANMGTFWGMFQIGGFNYKACGCETISEMVERMSDSEFEQLELFAQFITNSGMLPDLKAKNWSAFARKYNGSSYARRGYHTRMAQAYNKYKNQ